EPLYKRSLAIAEKAHGPDNPHVGASLSNLAWLYGAEGHYEEAEQLFKRSLAIFEKAQGADHPDVAAETDMLARFYENRGRHTDAEPLLKRSLAIREKTLGPERQSPTTSNQPKTTCFDESCR